MLSGKALLAGTVAVAACSQLGGGGGETYQHMLTMLCTAPPAVMQNVLTTPELKTAWLFICAHTQGVPATPVLPLSIAER